MSNKKLAVVLLSVAIVLFGAFAIWKLAINKPNAADNTQPTTTQTQESSQTYTSAQVAEHNTKNDCWTIISGSVYNITSYIPMHPGGDEILRACGADATTLFTQRTSNNGEEVGSGTPHSNAAQQQLTRYKVGSLAN